MIALTAGFVDLRVTVTSGAVASGAFDACAPVKPSTTAAPNPIKRRQAFAEALPGQPAIVQLPGDVTNFADI
jgi:hypothetical protein